MSKVRILRRPQVEEMTGLSRAALYSRMKIGNFPRPVKLGAGNAVGWLESVVEEWILEQTYEDNDS